MIPETASTDTSTLIAWAAPALLILARTLGVSLTAPAWNPAGLGFRMKLALAVTLAATLAPAVLAANPAPTPPPSLLPWLVAAACEFGLGTTLGLSAALVVAGGRQAGELVAAQAGIAPASVLDLEPGRDLGILGGEEALSTPLGHLYGLLAVGVYLSLDGPRLLIEALVQSFHAIPIGFQFASTSSTLELSIAHLFTQVTSALGLALRAAAPAGLAVLSAGVALAWLGRAAAVRSLTSLDWPFRSAIGLVMTLLSLATVAAVFHTAWAGWAALAAVG